VPLRGSRTQNVVNCRELSVYVPVPRLINCRQMNDNTELDTLLADIGEPWATVRDVRFSRSPLGRFAPWSLIFAFAFPISAFPLPAPTQHDPARPYAKAWGSPLRFPDRSGSSIGCFATHSVRPTPPLVSQTPTGAGAPMLTRQPEIRRLCDPGRYFKVARLCEEHFVSLRLCCFGPRVCPWATRRVLGNFLSSSARQFSLRRLKSL